MTTDFGLDMWSGPDDIDDTRTASGLELVAQDAVWRLKTPRSMGILEGDAPDYGMDLLEALGSVETDSDVASLPGRIRNELKEDPRILTVETDITRTLVGAAVQYDIKISCTTADGPFDLVGTADSASLNLEVVLLPGGV